MASTIARRTTLMSRSRCFRAWNSCLVRGGPYIRALYVATARMSTKLFVILSKVHSLLRGLFKLEADTSRMLIGGTPACAP